VFAEPLPERVLEHQETQLATSVADASVQHLGEVPEQAQKQEPRNAKKDPWLSQMMRKIVTRFRPAKQSTVVSQGHTAATKMADVSTREEDPQAHQSMVHAQEYREPSSTSNGMKVIKSASMDSPCLPRHRLSLPDETEIVAIDDEGNAPETTAQRLLRRRRETAAPVVPWPGPTVRLTTTETEHWSFPLPAIFGERNLTTAASSSWKQSPDQENAPGLPLLPSEFQSSTGSSSGSGTIYPWPELPQIVVEDPSEPRKLLQNHERQMRVLREQRGNW